MKKLTALASILGLCLLATPALSQTVSQVNFDNNGAEAGITVPGATSFSVFGSDWAGGKVQTQFIPSLYASGGFSYHVLSGAPTTVHFHNPIQAISFFFVHNGTSVPPGTMNWFNSMGVAIGFANSKPATFFGDPANFVTITDPDVAYVSFGNGGVIDNFSFTTSTDCAPGAALCGDRHQLRLGPGGQQQFTLNAGAAFGGMPYFLLGSASGTAPGIVLDGLLLPLNPDAYMSFALTSPVLTSAIGLLSATGQATASFNLPPGTSLALQGLQLNHAFAVLDPVATQIVFTSNAEPVVLVQ